MILQKRCCGCTSACHSLWLSLQPSFGRLGFLVITKKWKFPAQSPRRRVVYRVVWSIWFLKILWVEFYLMSLFPVWLWCSVLQLDNIVESSSTKLYKKKILIQTKSVSLLYSLFADCWQMSELPQSTAIVLPKGTFQREPRVIVCPVFNPSNY